MKKLIVIIFSFIYLCGYGQSQDTCKHNIVCYTTLPPIYECVKCHKRFETINGDTVDIQPNDTPYVRYWFDTTSKYIVIDTTQYLRFDNPKKQFDTIPVVLIYIDTSNYILWKGNTLEYDSVENIFIEGTRIDTIYFDDDNQKGGEKWKFGYSVREKHNTGDGVFDHMPPFNYEEYWVHLYYLDDKKKPLPESIIVTQSINRK